MTKRTVVGRSLFDIIRALLYAGWRRRYLIVVPFLLMIPISIVGSRLAPKTFEAKMLLLLQETSKDNPFLKDYAVGLNVKDRISALQALLRSEHVLANVLRDITPGAASKPVAELAFEMRDLAGRITVQLIGSDLLELRLKGRDPKGMGKLLDAISVRFLERLLSPERSVLGSTQAFLKQQMERQKKSLEEAERALAAFKVQNSEQLTSAAPANLTRLTSLRQRLEEKRMELSAATAAFRDMRRQLAGTNPIVGRLEESIVQLTSEMTSLKSRYTDDHSEVQSVERRLQRLQAERNAYIEVSRQIDQIDIDKLWNMAAGQPVVAEKAPPLLVSQLLRLQESQARRVALEQDVEQLKQAIHELNGNMAEQAPIERQEQSYEKAVVAARELYESFVKRYNNAATSHALGLFEAPERVKIIDHAQDPALPVTPPRIVFVIAGIVAGMLLGIGLAVVAEMLDGRLRDPDEIARTVKGPIFATLPHPSALYVGDSAAALRG